MKAALGVGLRWALAHLDYVQVLLVMGGLAALLIIYKLQKAPDNGFDVVDMVLDGGKASLTKFSQLGAFLISSWGFVYLTAHNQLTEWFFSAYMFSWAGAGAMTKWLDSRKPSGDGDRRDGDPAKE